MIIHAGRVFCQESGIDGPGAVAVRDGRIAEVRPPIEGSAEDELRFLDGILVPGLIDLHAHPARNGSVFGVEPDTWMLPRGTTTVASQGDAGADNIADYIDQTIRASQTRVRLAINLSRVGESTEAGCFEQLGQADVNACIAAVDKYREFIWAIAVNVSHHACGATDPRDVMRRGLDVASHTGLPLLFGMRRPEDWPLAEQLALLRPGDVVTYCFRRQPHCIVNDGRVLPEVREARDRGVLFDVGHGRASFDFTVAETAIADGFCPDTISTDLQVGHTTSGQMLSLPCVMSKLHAAGMTERDVFAAVTSKPVKILGLQSEIGTLQTGAAADLTVLHRGEDVTWTDCADNQRDGLRWLVSATIRDGALIRLIQHD